MGHDDERPDLMLCAQTCGDIEDAIRALDVIHVEVFRPESEWMKLHMNPYVESRSNAHTAMDLARTAYNRMVDDRIPLTEGSVQVLNKLKDAKDSMWTVYVAVFGKTAHTLGHEEFQRIRDELLSAENDIMDGKVQLSKPLDASYGTSLADYVAKHEGQETPAAKPSEGRYNTPAIDKLKGAAAQTQTRPYQNGGVSFH